MGGLVDGYARRFDAAETLGDHHTARLRHSEYGKIRLLGLLGGQAERDWLLGDAVEVAPAKVDLVIDHHHRGIEGIV